MAPVSLRPPRSAEVLAAAVGYALAGFALLYPIFANPGREIYAPASVLVRPVAAWVMWILAWDMHALADSAQPLFDANVFHPAAGSLALADPLLGVLPLFAPAYVLTGNPVAAYQFALLATLALCGAAMYALARHWGLGAAAALVGGAIYAFCPARLAAMDGFVNVSGQYLPLALIFVGRLLVRRDGEAPALSARARDALLLFVFAAWQVACATPLGYAALLSLAVYVAGALLSRTTRSWAGAGVVLAALCGAGLVLVILTSPQRAYVASDMFTGRTVAEFAEFSSANSWRDYLIPPYAWRLGLDGAAGAVYAGWFALGLMVLGIRVAGHARIPLLVLAGASWWLSLGPEAGGWLAPYRWMAAALPGFAVGGPEPLWFSLPAMLAVAGLAAFGAEWLVTALRRYGWRVRWLAVLAMCAALSIDYRLPFQHFETQRIRSGRDELPLYAALADLPRGPVLQIPMQTCAPTDSAVVVERQFASTTHWNPLLDGYRHYERAPASYSVVRAMAGALPDERALQLLRRAAGLRYLVVHLTDLPGQWRRRWRAVPGLERVGFFGHDLLFAVAQEEEADLAGDLLALPRSKHTLTGVALADLADADRAAGFHFTEAPPNTAAVGFRLRAEIVVENRSAVAWPALTTADQHRVYLSYLWTDAAGNLVGGDGRAQALPLDLGPGEAVVVPVCVQVPAKAGAHELAFGLSQGDRWFPDFSEKVRIRVVE